MPHVTFIHGIGNKPAPDVLIRLWRDALARDDGLDLGAEGVTSSMVYWADVLYESPQEEVAEHESNESIIAKTDPDLDMSWQDALGDAEKIWVDKLTGRLDFEVEAPNGDEDFEPPVSEMEKSEEAIPFERIPLPWWLKRRLMKSFLRDVHHYLFNADYSPRAGVTYRVRDEIRGRMITELEEGAEKPGPHAVVSHSMGTVIAYECLKRVPDCPQVDALVTIGSPLGLDEIQDQLRPEWTREDGYPKARVESRWVNVYDRYDPVAGFDAKLANDYKRGGAKVVSDVNEQNYGRWRHNISKYLGGPRLRVGLTELLGIQ